MKSNGSKTIVDPPESPNIVLPDQPALIDRLQQKLREYEIRLVKEQYLDPYTPPEMFGVWYAIRILRPLLEEGQVNTWQLARKIASEHHGNIPKLEYFERYCAVLDDYVTTGGANARGGTGINGGSAV